jgi:hypothetical protein
VDEVAQLLWQWAHPAQPVPKLKPPAEDPAPDAEP